MSDFNIPIIEPTIDYSKVPPINQKRTIAFINHFVSHTVTYLNKFALFSEQKLFEFENKIQKVEAALEILEAKLSSIPELQNGEFKDLNKNNQISPVETETQKIDEPDNIKSVETADVKSTEAADVKPTEADNSKSTEPDKSIPAEPEVEKTETQPISSDPMYAKYFKMVHFGVPKQAVKLKMEQDGLDSSVLDDPNQLVAKQKPADSDSADS